MTAMSTFGHALLHETGLRALPAHSKDRVLRYFYLRLEMLVGRRIVAQLSPEQLEDFHGLFVAHDDDGAVQWLEQRAPEYRVYVLQEFRAIKRQMMVQAPAILAIEEALGSLADIFEPLFERLEVR